MGTVNAFNLANLNVTNPLSTTTGGSSFSTDLQSSVNRALQIAALPAQLIQADLNQVTDQSQEISQFASLFTALQNSVQSLGSAASSGAQSVSVSDSGVVQATLAGSVLPGSYTINVLDPGSEASAMSVALQPPVTDPSGQSISQSDSYTLTVNGTTYTIQPATKNLNSLAQAINNSGAPVQAVIVNLGSPTSPDYRLVLQATALGDVSIELTDSNNTALLNPLNTGSNASYTVNGQPPGGISSDSSIVAVAPGLNVTLKAQGTSVVTIAADAGNLASSLSSFANAFNSVVTEIQKNHGQNGGALTGNGVVLSLQQALQQLGQYTSSSGSITSLAQLGLEFTQQGTLTFDPNALKGLSQTQVNDALSFLGEPTSSGFLQYATNTLNGINDPLNGLIALQSQTFQTQIQNDQQRITDQQQRLAQLQQNLQAQMAKADALIAALQSQNTFLQGLFQFTTSNNPNARTAG